MQASSSAVAGAVDGARPGSGPAANLAWARVAVAHAWHVLPHGSSNHLNANPANHLNTGAGVGLLVGAAAVALGPVSWVTVASLMLLGSHYETTLRVRHAQASAGAAIDRLSPNGGPVDLERVIAAAATNARAGNCGEFAAVAFVYLFDRGVRPIEYASLTGGEDHAFIIIGRESGSRLDRPSTWGPTAVVCDAWDDEAYVASAVPRKLGTKGIVIEKRID